MAERESKALQGSLGAYLRFGGMLLIAVLIVVGGLSTLGCLGCGCGCGGSTEIVRVSAKYGEYNAEMTGDQWDNRGFYPGEPATRVIGGHGSYDGKVTLKWTPPLGANGFVFDHPPEPGGPPFVWKDRQPDDQVAVKFQYPVTPPVGVEHGLMVDVLEAKFGQGESSSVSFQSRVDFYAPPYSGSKLSQPIRLHQGSQPSVNRGPAPSANVNAWHIDQWIDPTGYAMTTELCQQLSGEAGRDTAFMALRLPVPAHAPTEAMSIPVLMAGGDADNKIEIMSYQPFEPVASIPVELKPSRFTFAANAFPAEEGKTWVALGPAADAESDCPANMNLPAGQWSYRAHLWLDLSAQQNNCVDCELSTYVCYEGQELPSFVPSVAGPLALKALGLNNYQDNEITCVGPLITRLNDTGWTLGGTGGGHYEPGDRIELHHYLEAGWKQATVEISSTLHIELGLYEGSWNTPNLGRPINGPVSFGFKDIWVVSEPLPQDIEDGAYVITLRATSTSDPSDQRVTSDVVYVGEWVAPPTGPLPVYLPMLVKH